MPVYTGECMCVMYDVCTGLMCLCRCVSRMPARTAEPVAPFWPWEPGVPSLPAAPGLPSAAGVPGNPARPGLPRKP